MLNLLSGRPLMDCDGVSRRNFLRAGALGAGTLTLSGLLRGRAEAAALGQPVKDTSVVWLWLAGGPTHVETFDPKMSAPSDYRSTTGEVKTNIPGITLGGTFPEMAGHMDKLAVVRSFAHKNSGHGGGTHWVNTGYDNRSADNGGVPSRPGYGAIVSRFRGPTNAKTGMPTYVALSRLSAGGAAFLGKACEPFSPSGEAKQNMTLNVDRDRVPARRDLLAKIDDYRRDADRSGLMEGLDSYEEQAFDLVLGNAPKAFDLKDENAELVKKYGNGLGQSMLQARRLCEAGCGFVTISYGGWDMHGKVADSMKRRGPEVDHAVATFLQDVYDRGMNQNILLVITGEFGRTPRVNKNAGRDHWAPLSTLALAGGGLKMGQVVGESAAKVDVPASDPIGPQDLMATVFHVVGIPQGVQYHDFFGRPVYMIEKGKPIRELV